MKIKKILLKSIIVFVVLQFLVLSVNAQSEVSNVGFDIDDNIGLQEISIPFFPQVSLPGDEYSTVLSWVSFAGGLFSIGLIIFWVFLILRAAFQALQSEGDAEGMAESFKKIQSLFVGASIAILFPIVLSILGGFFGLGNLWSWPAALRDCPNSSSSEYYFQEVLRQSDLGAEDSKAQANISCFGN